MKLFLEEDKSIKEAIVHVRYHVLDQKLKQVIEWIKTSNVQLDAKNGDEVFRLATEDIYYIESVDNRTFFYKQNEVYESNEKLYELEEKLVDTSFIRINKSTLVNMNVVVSVRALANYRLEATLENGEKVLINRHYMKQVKQYLKL